MVFNKDAVTDILWTPADIIIKSYFNSLDDEDRGIMQTVMEHSAIAKNGKMTRDDRALREIFPVQFHVKKDEKDEKS